MVSVLSGTVERWEPLASSAAGEVEENGVLTEKSGRRERSDAALALEVRSAAPLDAAYPERPVRAYVRLNVVCVAAGTSSDPCQVGSDLGENVLKP